MCDFFVCINQKDQDFTAGDQTQLKELSAFNHESYFALFIILGILRYFYHELHIFCKTPKKLSKSFFPSNFVFIYVFNYKMFDIFAIAILYR